MPFIWQRQMNSSRSVSARAAWSLDIWRTVETRYSVSIRQGSFRYLPQLAEAKEGV